MIALTFHVEKLHDGLVWKNLLKFLKSSQKYLVYKPRFTFFIYPFRAAVAGKDVKAKIKILHDMGHEIAQHTHFYKGTKIEKPYKENDLSRDNIKYCLERDFSYIYQAIKIRPRGFVAGGWVVNNVVMEELVTLGFEYDISHFSFRTNPFIFEYNGKKLVEIPTDCSVGNYFKKFWIQTHRKKHGYLVVYLHDYDLLNFKTKWLVKLFLMINKRKKFFCIKELKDYIRNIST